MGRVIPGQLEIPTEHLRTLALDSARERPVLLLVDDLAENLFAMEQLLRREDVEIISTQSGKEALDYMLDRRVALALVDVQMPEMDGFELARYMRSIERTRHVPIIFITAGEQDSQHQFQGYEAGAIDFLFKPVDVQVLRGKVYAFVSMERQRRALEQSEARFRRLYDLGWIGVVFTDLDRRFVDANDAFLNMVGYTREDVRAGRLSNHELTPERYASVDERAAVQLWTTGRFDVLQKEFRHRDGHSVPVLVGGSFMDEASVVVSFVMDMTEHKEAERVRELFVAMLGHDLRNPLGSVMAGAQIALSRTDDERIRKPIERVVSGGTRMLRLIDQILDMSRLRQQGEVELKPVPTDLSALLDEVLQGAPATRDRFRVEALGDTTGEWDPDRLFQILSNLVGNACVHGPAEEPIFVRIDGTTPGDVELRVRNSGPPIPDEMRRVIFEPFRSSANRPLKGLGLGLYITKQFVLAHGGRIEVESAEGEGTSFAVRLPRRS